MISFALGRIDGGGQRPTERSGRRAQTLRMGGRLPGLLAVSASLLWGCEATTAFDPSHPGPTEASEAAAQQATAAQPPLAYPYARGGTRLKAQHFRIEGAEQFRRFRDDALGVECAWSAARDGIGLRCLPNRRAQVYFLDAACQTPVVQPDGYTEPLAPGEAAPHRSLAAGDLVSVELDPRSICRAPMPTPRDAYRVAGPASLAPAATLFVRTEDGCARAGNANATAYYKLIPVSESAFAGGFPISVDVGGGLLLRRVRGDDGSEQTLGVTDPRGTFCEPLFDGHCAPGRLVDSGSSISCYGAKTSVCGLPEYQVTKEADGAHVYPLTFVETNGTGCTLASGRSYRQSVGPDITDMLPRGRRVRMGKGPLFREQVVAATTARTIPLDNTTQFGSQEPRYCRVVPAADGSYRCWNRTVDLAPLTAFSDPECTATIFYNYEPDISTLIVANGRHPPGVVRDFEPKEIRALYKVKPWAGEPTYTMKGGACIEDATVTGVVQDDFNPLVVVDEPVPLSVLPAVEAVDL